MSPYPKKIALDFTEIEVYEDYLISTVKEGVVFDLPHLEKIHMVFDTFFPDKLFGFISNRKNDYTVNPTCFMHHSKYPRLIGEAVLCHTKSSYNISQFEKKFYSRPFEAFFSLDECKSWIDALYIK